jgi:hypothetical protein
MKIQNVLVEDSGAALAYKQLSPLQVGVLRKIVSNRFDFDNPSPQASDAVEGLIALGLVNDVSLEATERGEAALNLATKYGSSQRNALAAAKNNAGRPDMDVPPEHEEFDIE